VRIISSIENPVAIEKTHTHCDEKSTEVEATHLSLRQTPQQVGLLD
jgi:hypothetical protein